MALKIRLRKQGRIHNPTYRLVVTDATNPRDGKYTALLGSYNPAKKEGNFVLKGISADNAEMTQEQNALKNKEELAKVLANIKLWIGKGAQLTDSAEKLIAQIAPELIQDLAENKRRKSNEKSKKRRAVRRARLGAEKVAPAKKAAAVEKPKKEASKAKVEKSAEVKKPRATKKTAAE